MHKINILSYRLLLAAVRLLPPEFLCYILHFNSAYHYHVAEAAQCWSIVNVVMHTVAFSSDGYASAAVNLESSMMLTCMLLFTNLCSMQELAMQGSMMSHGPCSVKTQAV